MTPQNGSELHHEHKATPQHLLEPPEQHLLLQPSKTSTLSHKSNDKKWYFIGGSILLFITAMCLSYFIFSLVFPTTVATDLTKSTALQPTPPKVIPLPTIPDAASSILTDNVSKESTLTTADNSSDVIDATTSANLIVGGIDENNF
jgi:hypothetical protein